MRFNPILLSAALLTCACFSLLPVTKALAQDSVPEQANHNVQKLEDMLHDSYMYNTELRAARAEFLSVRENLSIARSHWQPSLDASASVTNQKQDGSYFSSSSTEGTEKNIGLTLTQPVFRGGRTLAETGQARDIIAAQDAFLADKAQDILLDATTVYMDVLRDRTLYKLGANNTQVIARQLEATTQRFEVGELTKTDVAQAEARLAKARADQIKARADMKASQARYEKIIGQTPAELSYPLISFPFPETLDETIAQAEENNPQLRALEYIHKASEKDIKTAFGTLLPEVTFTADWARTYDPVQGSLDESTARTVALSAKIPLYQGGKDRALLRQSLHTSNQRFIETLEMRRIIRQTVITNWEALEAAKAEIASRELQVKAAQLAQEGVHEEADLGGRTILDSLDADQELMDSQAALVAARRDEVVASFSLAHILGFLAPEILGFEPVAF